MTKLTGAPFQVHKSLRFSDSAAMAFPTNRSGNCRACCSGLWRLLVRRLIRSVRQVVAYFLQCKSYNTVSSGQDLRGAGATEDGNLEGPKSSFEVQAGCRVGWGSLIKRKPEGGSWCLAEVVYERRGREICGGSQFQGRETNSLMPWHFCRRELGVLAWWGGSPRFAMTCRIAREEAEVGRNRDGQGSHDDVLNRYWERVLTRNRGKSPA